jgi:N-formylglutamate deformylase
MIYPIPHSSLHVPSDFRSAILLDDQELAAVGMGALYERTSSGDPLRNHPSLENRDALIQRFYVPHHKQLNDATRNELDRSGSALILDCHSFPSVPLPYERDQDPNRPDICIGADSFHNNQLNQPKGTL